MASYHESASIEIFHWGDIGTNEHQSPIVMVSSFDLDGVRSHPKLTKNASMNSFSTQWSSVTAQASNTTKQQSEKKRKRRKFLRFVKILLGIVKDKDEGRFLKAKTVVNNWERERHKHNDGTNNFSESLRCPLKQAVGSRFWSEARERMLQPSTHTRIKQHSDDRTTASDTDSSDITPTVQHTESCFLRSHMMPSPTQKAHRKDHIMTCERKESRTQKKRLWMVIRVFLKCLRKRHQHLYRKAHTLVNECMHQHRQGRQSESRKSLSGSVEACLKEEFGSELWMLAEQAVSEALLVRHENR